MEREEERAIILKRVKLPMTFTRAFCLMYILRQNLLVPINNNIFLTYTYILTYLI